MVTIRRAVIQDREQIASLWLQFLSEQAELDERFGVAEDARARWENDFTYWLSDRTRVALVAESGGEIYGFLTAHEWSPPPIYADSFEVYINELFVRPESRRQGIGSLLVEKVSRWAQSVGAYRLRLGTLAANEAARTFWKRQRALEFSLTLTIDLEQPTVEKEDLPRRKIGF